MLNKDKIIKLKFDLKLELTSPKVPIGNSVDSSDHLGMFLFKGRKTINNNCKWWYEDEDRAGEYEYCKSISGKVTCSGDINQCEYPEIYEEA